MRPQGTAIAASARNRESVMSLGSIAHMQYYFARTGLLDGKGGQLVKEREKKKSSSNKENEQPVIVNDEHVVGGSLSPGYSTSTYAGSDAGGDPSVVESPTDPNVTYYEWNNRLEPVMLPPTVSTYKQKPIHTEPLPELAVLRQELKESLTNVRNVLEDTQRLQEAADAAEDSGFHEIQGLHVLDITTLAIRAAKMYHTAHANPERLYNIRSERQIRLDLYQVLDELKRMAARNFRGGLKQAERDNIYDWTTSIDTLLSVEEAQEQHETAERESWVWRHGDWSGREREREYMFLRSFDPDQEQLLQWAEQPSELPNPFLLALQDGQRLIRLHNALLQRSKRRFGEIKTYHTDVAKPYRMAENLRYWIKAAELRWEIRLTVNVLGVVHGDDPTAWQMFDDAVLTWCKGVRNELCEEWEQDAVGREQTPPELKIEFGDSSEEYAAVY